MVKYVFDKKKGAFAPKRGSFWGILMTGLRYTLFTLLVAAVFYTVFALAFSTDREKQLEHENRLLAQEYEDLSRQLDVLEGAVGDLRARDRAIYRDLFNADPLNYIVEVRDTVLARDLESMHEDDLVWDAYALVKRSESAASRVSLALAQIDSALTAEGRVPTSIPSIVPVPDFSPRQTGASVGKKVNPFYKTVRDHDGLDIVAPAGTPVRCSADGRVAKVVRSEKGMGNQVFISHPGGFQTVYAHLEDISTAEGRSVRQGEKIGTVGQTGSCFAPCLHYEVQRDGFLQDPVNYFFAELAPAAYRDMMIVALTTGQSMD